MTSLKTTLKINKIDTDKDQIELNNNHHMIPRHPFRLTVVGASGSGKTNLIANLLSRTEFYDGYFDKVYVFSPTVNVDKIWRSVNITKAYEDFTNFSKDLKEILDVQAHNVEMKGIKRAPRVMICIDDFAEIKQVANAEPMKTLFTKSRHWNISAILGTQKYKALDRFVRLNSSDVILFAPINEGELTQMSEELSKFMKKKQFINLVETTTSEPYQFLYIRTYEQKDKRYRKGFNEIISIN